MVEPDTTAPVNDSRPVAETTSTPELDALVSALANLSKRLLTLKCELEQLAGYVKVALERGYGLEYVDDSVKILADEFAIDLIQLRLVLQKSYINTQRSLAMVFELQQSLLKSFEEMPHSIAAKLPAKDGSPWRSFYMRECLDILDKWPREVQKAIPYLESEIDVPGLITSMSPMGPRSGFPMHERFERFGLILEQAVREADSLRIEVAMTSIAELKNAAGETTGAVAVDKEAKATISPSPDTLKVIQLLKKGLSNDDVQEALKDDHKIDKTIQSIRQIRSRWERGRYVI
jgi:hypothetical protein